MRVPGNIAEAYKVDQENGNSLWTEAIDREVKLLRSEFECFRIGEESEITEDYQKIPLFWTFAVKFDARGKLYLDLSPISYEGTDFKEEDWTECYRDTEEYFDENAPEPKVDTVPITVFKDASYATCALIPEVSQVY